MKIRNTVLVLACILTIASAKSLRAQDCSEITKYGIFDVRHTRTQMDFVQDIIDWLTVNQFSTEQEAKNAGLNVGIVIPDVNIPINADGTYGENHAKTWSLAAASYFSKHSEIHTSFESNFRTANPNIVTAWQQCVSNSKGLICWAKQTDNPKEIELSLELRPLNTSFWTLFVKVKSIQYSPQLVSTKKDFGQHLGFGSPSPYIFSRKSGEDYASAANFVVETNDADYKCSATAPSLPLPPPPAPPAAEVAPHHNHPQLHFLVAFDDKEGAEDFGNGAWTRYKGITTIRVDFEPAFGDMRFKFTCHMEGKGDQPMFESGQTCGQEQVGLHLEGFSIELAGAAAPYYDVSYECLSASETTPRHGTNGQYCGTKGEKKQLQKARVTVVAKEKYRERE